MAYINRELALKLLERNSITKHITFSDGVSIYDTIANIPTADVVPKSEYENLKFQFDALDHECDRLERAESNRHDAIEQAKSEVAREIIGEINRYLRLNEDIAQKCKEENGEKNQEYWKGKLAAFLQIRGFIDAELKKKYTEDQT